MKSVFKSLSLASVIALALGVATTYAASPYTAAAKDDPTIERSAQMAQQTQATQASYAQNQSNDARDDDSASETVKEGLRNADDSLRDAADDIRAFFIGDQDGGKIEPVLIRADRTAHGMLGKPVLNQNNKQIAHLKDIIIDKNGKATMAIVSEGGFLGLGDKIAAFDYGRVISQRADGDIVMSLSENMIKEASDFSYHRKDRATSKVIPTGSFSVKDILDGELLDNDGETVGSIKNLSFDNGQAHRVIVAFNQHLGMGGDLAALNYAVLDKQNDGNDVDLKMNSSQSLRFEQFGKTAMR